MRTAIICLLSLAPAAAAAQSVIASGGDFQSNSEAAVSYTIGEPVIATASGSPGILTQGFQQPWVDINTVLDEPSAGPEMSVYPNPVRHTLHLALGQDPSGERYALYDAAGKLITDARIGSSITDIDMESYASGSYHLRVLSNDGSPLRTFKISLTR